MSIYYVLYVPVSVPVAGSHMQVFLYVFDPMCVSLSCYRGKTSEYCQGEIPLWWCDA